MGSPIQAMRDYVVGVGVALVVFHVFATFTLARRTSKQNGVSPWYGFVLGAQLFMMWIMIGLGSFSSSFDPYFEEVDRYYDVFEGIGDTSAQVSFSYDSKHQGQMRALMVLSYLSAGANALTFAMWVIWSNAICGEGSTLPTATSSASPRISGPGATTNPSPKSKKTSVSSKFRVTPLNDEQSFNSDSPSSSGPVPSMEMGGGGGSSLRFGADRFRA